MFIEAQTYHFPVDGESDDETEANDDGGKNGRSDPDAGDVNNDSALDDSPLGFINAHHRNYPVICEMYKDPETELDKVALVLTLPAGAQNVTLETSDGGDTVTIKYKWVQAMYNMRDLFSKMIAAKQITSYHPRVLCIKKGLEKSRKRMDAAPEGMVRIMLPIRVQTSAETWSYNPVKRDDGTLILMADFTGYVKEYTAKIRDVRFD